MQGVDVAQNKGRLAEGTGKILSGRQIDGGFSTYGGVHSRQKGSGNLNKSDAPQVGGCGKAGQISHHAAAQGYNQITAGQIAFCQKIQKGQVGFSVFGGFSRRKHIGNRLKAGALKAFLRYFPVQRPYIAVADNADS